MYSRSLIAIDAADRKSLEEKVFRHLARMPPLRGEGDAFRKKLTRNREGNTMREEYHQAAMDTTDKEEAIADDWEELDVKEEETEVKQEIKNEPQETSNEPSDEFTPRWGSSEVDDRLASEYRKQQMAKGYTSMFEFRKKLPAYKQRRELIEIVRSNQVVVVSGETGCGKTTQVPQFILEDALESGKGSKCRDAIQCCREISQA